MSFSFGAPTTTTGSTGFSFGTPAAASTANTGFSFSTPTPANAATGGAPPAFSFSTPAQPVASQPNTTGFSFGQPSSLAAPSAAAPPSFGAATGAPRLGGGSAQLAPSTAPPSFSFNTPTASVAPISTTSTPTAGGLFGTPSAAPATTTTSAAPSLSLFGASAVTTPATTTTTSTLPTFGAATGASTGFAAPSFGGGAATATTTASTGISFGAAAQPAVSTSAPLTLTMSTTTTESKAAGQQMTFTQLEENINKWTLKLEELEKLFLNQATQVNAWDKVLLSNGDKIVALNEEVEKAKAEQNALEQELEFIGAQHTELEDCIVPLETELAKIPQVDIERGQTYQLAETLDYQLKQMSDDLKEVIECLNEANKFADPNDPMVQIGKILNAHMTSLQWIDSTTNTISQKLEDIQKMHDTIRKDNERSFRLTYYDS